MDSNGIVILAVVAFMAFYFVLRYVINIGANKINDSVRNAYVRNKETKNPPKKERLADRYAGTQYAVNAAVSSNVTNAAVREAIPVNSEPEELLKFCPYCGSDLSEMEKDDLFCPNCGSKLR